MRRRLCFLSVTGRSWPQWSSPWFQDSTTRGWSRADSAPRPRPSANSGNILNQECAKRGRLDGESSSTVLVLIIWLFFNRHVAKLVRVKNLAATLALDEFIVLSAPHNAHFRVFEKRIHVGCWGNCRRN